MPGGGVKLDDQGQALAWQATPANFPFHHGTLVRVYKAKLADELRAAGLYPGLFISRLALACGSRELRENRTLARGG